MTTPLELVSQHLADDWTHVAQRYAGYFYGRMVTAGQHGKADSGRVYLSDEPFVEPLVFEDDCSFCAATTDERVLERVRGFQEAIDIEVIFRGQKSLHYSRWRDAHPDLVKQLTDRQAKRMFIRESEDAPTEKRPHGWRRTALDLTRLPLHLQRRLCIEWNHLLRDWLEANSAAFEYDLETHTIRVREPEKTLAADPEEQQALEELREEDRAYAATPFGGDGLAEQAAASLEAGM